MHLKNNSRKRVTLPLGNSRLFLPSTLACHEPMSMCLLVMCMLELTIEGSCKSATLSACQYSCFIVIVCPFSQKVTLPNKFFEQQSFFNSVLQLFGLKWMFTNMASSTEARWEEGSWGGGLCHLPSHLLHRLKDFVCEPLLHSRSQLLHFTFCDSPPPLLP